jgi:hypothetical protein
VNHQPDPGREVVRCLAAEVYGKRSGNTRRVSVTRKHRIVINLKHAHVPESQRLSTHQAAWPISWHLAERNTIYV